MADLSRRGRALVDAPAQPPYIAAHFERRGLVWDPEQRPEGYIPLCIAENKRRAPALLELLSRYGDFPAGALAYDDVVGNLDFRRNLAGFMGRSFLGRPVDAESLSVLAGAGSVLEILFYALADPGEGVLVPMPSYAGFWPDLGKRDGLEIVPVPRCDQDGFALTEESLERALRSATVPVRALLLTSPCNPLGRVYAKEELERVVAWAEGHDIHVVFDEIYALSVFGDRPFVSAASLAPSLGDRRHVVWAFSKDFGASGLRCGVLLSENEAVRTAVRQLAYWSVVSGTTQHLLSRLVADEAVVDAYVAAMRADLREAYRTATGQLERHGIPYVPAEAGFFVLCDLRAHLDAPTWEGERRLWRRVLDVANVNLTPGEAFGATEPGLFRLCYAAVPEAAVEAAVRRLGALLG